MNRKHQLTLVFSLIGMALGIGHVVQSTEQTSAAAATTPPSTNVDVVSTGPEQAAPQITPVTAPANAAVLTEVGAPEPVNRPKPDLMMPVEPQATSTTPAAPVADPTSFEPAATPGGAGSDAAASAITAAQLLASPSSAPVAATPATETADAACPITMKVAVGPQAMIGVSIQAPCAPEARVVVEHEGLKITQKTDATGSVFLSIPALAVDATITATVANADPISENLRVPAMTTLRRFGVQWQDRDAFQLHAFENGADYGDAGHLSEAAPHTPLTGAPPASGYVTLLGNADVARPMMAQIYTFPEGGISNNDVLVEAIVTDATCGREMLGETIIAMDGKAYTSELTLAMPDCNGVSDILVLKNLMADMTIATAD
jgi:hypothetical protein